jgi:glutamate-5-semialdehyde dehydrogenase
MSEVLKKAREAREAALELAKLPLRVRNRALLRIARAIERSEKQLLEANALDVRKGERMVKRGELTAATLQRLKLSPSKVRAVAEMVRSVAGLPDPLGRTVYAMEMDRGLEVYKITCPIGVVGVVFEARPDVLPQIAALCLKSGNAVIMKGGREATHSNRAFYQLIRREAEAAGVPRGWIQLIEARREVRELLKLDQYVDLLIPRGSKSFIQYVQANTRIPVLGHAEGVCHVYVDERANLSKALRICYDAKVQYPAVCNAAETILVHSAVADRFLQALGELYKKAGVEIRGCPRTRRIIGWAKAATEADWKAEYLDLVVSIRVVDSLQEAIQHINRYGSGHTDAIVTENTRAALEFVESVDSSSVMVNTSTRFSDGYRYGLGAEVGISTTKIHARGPVGLEGLTTTKYVVVGDGHVVSDYLGDRARRFTHRPIRKEWAEALR